MENASSARPPSIPATLKSPRISSPVPTREAAFAVTAGFLGWTLDAFDFFLVVIALPRIAAGLPGGEV